jgi:hypothetical protein
MFLLLEKDERVGENKGKYEIHNIMYTSSFCIRVVDYVVHVPGQESQNRVGTNRGFLLKIKSRKMCQGSGQGGRGRKMVWIINTVYI